MSAFARLCFRHRVIVLLSWLTLLVGALVAAKGVGSAYITSFAIPNTDSTRAMALLQAADPQAAGDRDTIVWRARPPATTVTDPAVERPITALLDTVAGMPQVVSVHSPYGPHGAAQISKGGDIAYAQVNFAKLGDRVLGGDTGFKNDVQHVIDAVKAANTGAVEVEIGGNAVEQSQQKPPSVAETLGFVAAFVVMLLAFGSLLGALLPIATAIFGLGVGTSLITLVSHVTSISSLGPIMAALIGIGVGIDYSLFIVTRFRTGVQRGLGHEDAVVTALNSSGRAVLFAGMTVVIALLGLLASGMSFIGGAGVAASIAVAAVVVAALTLLPALLGFRWVATRVLSRRERRRLRETGPISVEPQGVWARWAGVVERRPRLFAAIAVAIMAVLIVPLFSLRLGASDAGNDASATTTRKAYDLLADGFGPGFDGPLLMVAEIDGPGDAAALDRLVAATRATPGVAAVHAAPTTPDQRVAVVEVVPTTSPESAQTATLVDTLRNSVIPRAEQGTGLQAHVGGGTATNADFSTVTSRRLPLFLAVVVGFGFLLLMVAFRSLAIPLSAAVMNLLASGATFGVIIAVFQWGWGSETLGLGAAGPIEAFVPVMMLALLFGLSMDYQVFLVSRVHEEWLGTGDNRRAVRVGQAETGKVITAAAVIMICVFTSFLLIGQRGISEFGLAVAAAVLVDAFVLRMMLVPALMHLLGRANWWIPRALDRVLPAVSLEGAAISRPEPDFDRADAARSPV